MEYPVIHGGRAVGSCSVREDGLYWCLECWCELLSDRVERLYSGTKRLGVLEREGDRLHCRRRLSRHANPDLLPESGVFTLHPAEKRTPWEGALLGRTVSGFREGDMLLFPYRQQEPCPCEPLICFFEIKDGFWRLPADPRWTESGQDGG